MQFLLGLLPQNTVSQPRKSFLHEKTKLIYLAAADHAHVFEAAYWIIF